MQAVMIIILIAVCAGVAAKRKTANKIAAGVGAVNENA